MKKINFAAVLAAALVPFFAAAEEISHAVSAASVFTDRAVITRTGTAHLKKGKNEIVFAGVRDNIDLRSIRAGTDVPAGVKILGVSWERRVSKTVENAQIAARETRLAELRERKTVAEKTFAAIWTRLRVAQEFETFFRRSVSEQCAVGNGAGTAWNEDAAALKNALKKLYAQAKEASDATIGLNEEIAEAQAALDEIYGDGNARRALNLIVTLEAENDADAEIPVSVSYATRCASWKPRYDALADESAGTIDFAYNGVISQNTGEDWNDVKLTLSTAQPQIGAFPPNTRPVSVRGKRIVPETDRQIVVESAAEARIETGDQRALFSAPEFRDNGGEKPQALSTVRAQGASITFEIAGTHDVPSGGRPHQVAIARKVFENVRLRCEAAPARRGDVYFRADMKNETPYPILAGEIAISRGSGFVGNSKLAYAPVNANVPFFAGTVEGLSVAVEKLAPYRGKKKKLMSSSSGTTLAEGEIYTLSNLTGTPRKVRVRAQIKVSEIDDVKISVLEKDFEHIPATTPGYVLEKETGMLYWDADVPANGETRLVLSTKTESGR